MERRRRRVGSDLAPDGEATPRGRAFPLPILMLVLLAAAIALLPPIRDALTRSDQHGDGYADIVSAAIERGWLYVVPGEGDTGDVDGRVERARGSDVPAAFDRFITASFLREDMATLDPAIWRYNGSDLDIDPRAHLVGGAYDGVGGWRGSLLFADTRVEQQLLDDRGTTTAWLVENPKPGACTAPAAADGQNCQSGRVRSVNLGRAAPAPATAEDQPAAEADAATELRFLAPVDGGTQEVARIRRIGGHALLRVLRRERNAVRVRVGGADAAPRASPVSWHVLESGETLSFEWAGGVRRYQFVQTESAISRARGDAQRVREPSLATLAVSVEGAVGSGAQSIHTSIDSRIHGIAQQALVTQAMTFYDPDQAGNAGITSFRAAAVLMDGLTGEIAALPTFPAAPEHLHPSQRGSPTHRKMLERNSNFVRLVAGSTAKAPMAMAVINQYPMLTGLTIQGASPFRVLFGVDLGTPVPDQAGGSWDFKTFLARSSNKYAASLMLLGLSDAQSLNAGTCGGPSNEPFAIGGRSFTCRPAMPFMENVGQGRLGVTGSWSGAAPGWANNLYTLFCINPNNPDDAPPVPSEACLPEDAARHPIWRGAAFGRPRLLTAASPDREGFGLQFVDKIYEDYVMTILGGNRGRWTTIGLAQAYSRILTGFGVTARLTPVGDGSGDDRPEEVALPFNAQARERMVEALRAVVEEGTAQAVKSAGFPSDEFRLFAKTGTPNVSFLGDDERAILQEFASANCGLRLTERAARRGAAARAELVVGSDPALPIARAIAARSDCTGRFAPAADRIAELIGQLNRSPSLARVRVGNDGRVISIPPNVSLSEGTGNLLVLMVARYRPGARDTDRPCSLRTIAINFQARTPEQRRPAMAYALSLLRNDITRAWFMGTPCGQGAAA